MLNTTDKDLEKPNWLTAIFALDGTIILYILPRILFFYGLTLTIVLLYSQGSPIYLDKFGDLTSNVIFNLILGLLVGFCTNTSYDRFWEGRKAWGALVINIRIVQI